MSKGNGKKDIYLDLFSVSGARRDLNKEVVGIHRGVCRICNFMESCQKSSRVKTSLLTKISFTYMHASVVGAERHLSDVPSGKDSAPAGGVLSAGGQTASSCQLLWQQRAVCRKSAH